MNGFGLQKWGFNMQKYTLLTVNKLTDNMLTTEFSAKIYNAVKIRFLLTSFLKKSCFFLWYIFVINNIKIYVSKKEKNAHGLEDVLKNWGVNMLTVNLLTVNTLVKSTVWV